jgi:tRNA pseudouridine synthase 10
MNSLMKNQPDFLDRARAIIAVGEICDFCLGRQFAQLGHNLSNRDRGKALRVLLAMIDRIDFRPATDCWICQMLFARLDQLANQAVQLAQAIEFDTYLFAVNLTPRIKEIDRIFSEQFGVATAESFKHDFNRELGKAFEQRFIAEQTERSQEAVKKITVAFTNPHLLFTVDLRTDRIDLHIASLYLSSRYRKLIRSIPQTRWFCRHCHGNGCTHCNFQGKMYQQSVEEIINAPIIAAAQAEDAILHGAGREDIDALMLGTGRPFIMEIVAPRRRSLDIAELKRQINSTAVGKVEIESLSIVDRSMVKAIKETKRDKRYRVVAWFAKPITQTALTEALRKLVGPIVQQTPQRVSHRRADLVRTREVIATTGEMQGSQTAELQIHCEGGLYVKELISGDDGRTVPSLTAQLGINAQVVELDVIAVLDPQGREVVGD